jgi:tRNA (guanine-N7-)-methyltransferase
MKSHPYAEIAPRLPEGDPLDPRTLLAGTTKRLELEIGPGRGGFIFERLEEDPEVSLLGLEIRLKWATIVDRRLRERGLGGRARVFAEDARAALRRFPEACLDAAFVHFPDPWWKKRHHKRLVVEKPLLGELARTLRPGGQVFLQTDVLERAQAYASLFAEHPAFLPVGAEPEVAENPFAARSPRERRAIADGLPIHRLFYSRV